MITFDEGHFRFNYRVVGIVLDSQRVLIHKGDDENFWSLPGGRGEFQETARDTLVREMQEEMGVDVEVVRLLWVVENFFTYDDKDYHELALYFLMNFPEDSTIRRQTEFTEYDDGKALTFRWHSLDDLANLIIQPSFLKTALKHLPETTEHIVHRDEPLK